jgi:hypothetical protein
VMEFRFFVDCQFPGISVNDLHTLWLLIGGHLIDPDNSNNMFTVL